MSATFHTVSTRVIDDLLAADPALATHLGDHRWDHLLPDYSNAAIAQLRERLDDHLTTLDAIDDVALPLEEQVDLEILRARVSATQLAFDDIDRRTWDPLMWNPGTAVYLLLARDFAPAQERIESVVARLRDIPRFLADARVVLAEMSGIHVETAIAQLAGFPGILDQAALLARETDRESELAEVSSAGAGEVEEFRSWLAARAPESRRDPRLGVRLYSAALWHNLDEEIAPIQVLEAAERHLDDITTRMREVAAQFTEIGRAHV